MCGEWRLAYWAVTKSTWRKAIANKARNETLAPDHRTHRLLYFVFSRQWEATENFQAGKYSR